MKSLKYIENHAIYDTITGEGYCVPSMHTNEPNTWNEIHRFMLVMMIIIATFLDTDLNFPNGFYVHSGLRVIESYESQRSCWKLPATGKASFTGQFSASNQELLKDQRIKKLVMCFWLDFVLVTSHKNKVFALFCF